MPKDKQAVWYAMNSDDGGRLLEIAREQIALIREITVFPADWNGVAGAFRVANDATLDIYQARVRQLGIERDTIIQKYEGSEQECAATS